MPKDHPLRGIDQFPDLSDVRPLLAPSYSSHGRPSIDPELMIRMLLLGYCQGIRSERRLCEEAHVNPAYRWFCRLDLTDPVPDHSTFSKNRRLLDRIADRFGMTPDKLVGETGYGSAEMLGWLVEERGIAPHIPVWDKSKAIHRRVDDAASWT